MSPRTLLVTIALTTVLALPGVAAAQGDAFGPIPQAPPTQTEPAPSQQTASSDDGLSPLQQLLVGSAGLVLLFGIAWAIMRDARQAAPADDRRRTADGGERPKGTRPTPTHRTHQRHKKSKAARKARKRNR